MYPISLAQQSSKLYKVESAHKDSIFTCDWVRHVPENRLLTGSVDETVASWTVGDQTDGKENVVLGSVYPEHHLGAVSVVGNPVFPVAISSAMDSRVRILDLEGDCKVKSTLDVGPVECWTMACSPDGMRFASGTHTGAVNIWDLASEKLVTTLDTQGAFVLSVAYSPDGKMIAAGSKDGVVYVFDAPSGRATATLTNHTMPVRSLSFAPDSSLLYSASGDMTVGIYDAVAGAQVGSLRGHMAWVLDVCASPDKRLLATGSSDNTVKLWDVDLRTCVQTFEKSHTSQVHGVSFNHDGSRLASVGGEGNVQVYSVATPP